MPYEIVKHGRCFSVVNTETGMVHSRCSTKANAEAQMRLLYGIESGMFKPTGKKIKSPAVNKKQQQKQMPPKKMKATPTMGGLMPLKMEMSANQVSKVRNGKTVQLKPEQIGSGSKTAFLDSKKHKKMMAAAMKGKGIRLTLEPEEIEASMTHGEGFSFKKLVRGIAEGAKKVGRFYRKNVRPLVAPVIRRELPKLIKSGLVGLAEFAGQPELIPMAGVLADRYASPLVNKFGDVTGAYGLPRGKKGTKKDAPSAVQAHLINRPSQVQQGTLVSYVSPAMHPYPPLPDFSQPDFEHTTASMGKGLYAGGREGCGLYGTGKPKKAPAPKKKKGGRK